MCPSAYSPLDHSHVPLHLLPIGPLPCSPPLTPHWTTPVFPSTYSPLDHSHVAPMVETRPPCTHMTSAHDKVPHVPHPVLLMFIQYTFSCRSQPDQQCCAILFGDCGGYGEYPRATRWFDTWHPNKRSICPTLPADISLCLLGTFSWSTFCVW